MIYELSPKERKELRSIVEGYSKLIKDVEAQIIELAPATPRPDDIKLFDEWLSSGSQEWRDARERRSELIRAQSEARAEYLRSVYDAHFAKLGNDPDAIVKNACEEIDAYIVARYNDYEETRTTGISEYGTRVTSFSARDVRATESGLLLDADAIITDLSSSVVSRHIKALGDDKERIAIINEYLVKAVAESPYTSSEVGELCGEVVVEKKKKKTTEEALTELITYPKDYVTTVDRVSKQIFSNELTRPLDAEAGSLWEVRLDGSKSGKVFARAAIDYKELIESGKLTHLPTLTAKHYIVHDAIITQLLAGNRKMSYEMIYRAMTGKVTGKVEVPDDMIEFIDESLLLFSSRVQLKYKGKNPDGDEIDVDFDEPLVTFNRASARLNGKLVGKVVVVPEDTRFDPLLLKWARVNGNEIDTRDITLLDVPRLNNGDESLLLKMCLYRRLFTMRNAFERVKKSKQELAENLRTIRYDFVYDALGISEPNKDKRKLIKDKIDRCMSYWKEKGFIADYEHRKDKAAGNQYYAVVVWFMPRE